MTCICIIHIRVHPPIFHNRWLEFAKFHRLVNRAFSLSEHIDRSSLGAELQFLTEEQSHDELTNFWPGIGVSGDGYVPVASCLLGSGDYYYINANDGPNGPLHRIYHDAVGPDGYNPGDAVATVLDYYEEVLAYAEP